MNCLEHVSCITWTTVYFVNKNNLYIFINTLLMRVCVPIQLFPVLLLFMRFEATLPYSNFDVFVEFTINVTFISDLNMKKHK